MTASNAIHDLFRSPLPTSPGDFPPQYSSGALHRQLAFLLSSSPERAVIETGIPGLIKIPARPADHKNAWSVLLWVIANYGTAFNLPSLDVLHATAEEAPEKLFSVADGKRGFEKVLFRHSLR
jgi:hypothetical protein